MRRIARPLLYLGTVAIVLGLGKYHARYIGHYVFHDGTRLPWTLAYGAVLWISAYAFGLPDLDRRRGPWPPAIAAAVSAAGVMSLFQLVFGAQLLPRFVVFASVLLVTPWFAACASFADVGRGRQEGRERVVLVAGPEEQAALEREMGGDLERPAVLVAQMTPAAAHSVDPRSKPLLERVIAERGTVIVLDRVASLDETIVSQAANLHEAGLRVRPLSLFYDEWLGKLPLSELERMSLMFDVGELQRVRYGRVKRLTDVAACVAGLMLLIAVIPLVLIGDLVANRGPLFYRQPRVGRGGRQFTIFKFRTMRPGDGAEWTADGDTRVTPFGRILRRSHVDELPQVINIFRGDQSLVGPRPEQPTYVAELRQKIPFYDLRHLVRPGLTGWAQVKYPYGASELDAIEKLQYEFYYLRHQSLALDVRIIVRTLRSVIGARGR